MCLESLPLILMFALCFVPSSHFRHRLRIFFTGKYSVFLMILLEIRGNNGQCADSKS